MNKLLLLLALLALLSGSVAMAEQRTPLNQGWDFRLQQESQWRTLTLPHDWSIEGSFDKSNAMGNDGGYLPDGVGFYRKMLHVDSREQGERISLYFEGSYMRTTVYLNGESIGSHAYGYTSFFVDLTPHLKFGADNEILVKVDNSMQKNCRWYSGSGLFRNVWLVKSEAVHLKPWSTFVTTPSITDGQAKVLARTIVCNDSQSQRNLFLQASIGDQQGRSETVSLAPGEQKEVSLSLVLPNPHRWNPEDPYLYNIYIRLGEDAKTLDETHVEFGVRTISYTAERGFELNGKPLTVFGGCIHHDNGILGAAAFDRAEERKVELMKAAGFNCVRTSHNPVSEAFLRACDHKGLMVIDEAFDGWRDAKNAHDYHELIDSCWQEDISALVLRDRNHPSIISWSIGNEVIERKKIEIITTAHKLAGLCRKLDPTRPVTEALAAWDPEWEIYDPLAAEHEVIGYNYLIHRAPADHERVPDRVIWQTESYPRDAFSNWCMVNDNPYIIGDFVWTAIDYLGESGIGRYYYEGETPGEHYQGEHWPWHGAYCGDIDITGWRKPISYYRQLLFDPDHAETLHLAVREPDGYWGKIHETSWSVWPTWDSWNWPGWEGKPVEVEIYTREPSVKLYLNDQLVGEKAVSRETGFKAVFSVNYQSGVLRAEAGGKTVTLQTAGEPYAVRLTPDRTRLKADGEDLSYVTVEIVDRSGRVCPNAEIELDCVASGKVSLAAAGNADLQDCGSYLDGTLKTWKGRGLVILRSSASVGSFSLKVSGKGVKGASVRGRSE